MARRSAAAPRRVHKEPVISVCTSLPDLVRKLVIETDGGLYGLFLKGRRVCELWQAVPGYSDNLDFILEGSSSYVSFHKNNTCEVEYKVSTDSDGSKVITLTAGHKGFATCKHNPYSLDATVLEKSKVLVLGVSKLTSKRLMCYNGTL